MTPTEEAALEIVTKMLCLFEEAANVTRDRTLRDCAERGTRFISEKTAAAEMLEKMWGTAHVVNVRLGIMLNAKMLTPQQAMKTVQFCAQFDHYIREALFLLHPETYGFLAESLATGTK